MPAEEPENVPDTPLSFSSLSWLVSAAVVPTAPVVSGAVVESAGAAEHAPKLTAITAASPQEKIFFFLTVLLLSLSA